MFGRKLQVLLLAVVASGLIVAGCGDDDDDGGGGSDAPATTQESASPEASAEATEDSGGGAATGASQQAVEACKQSVNAQPQLSDDVKGDLEGICEDAASGDEEAVRNATKEVCVKIVEETVPEGSARDQAKSACEQAAP